MKRIESPLHNSYIENSVSPSHPPCKVKVLIYFSSPVVVGVVW